MQNFWDSGVWGTVNLAAVLLISLIVGNALKKTLKFLRRSLIPTSVLGGLLLMLVGMAFRLITGKVMLDTEFFGGSGMNMAETITYHCLALGFIATVFKHQGEKMGKERTREIFNTGVTTVSTYLLQGILGLGITIVWAMFSSKMFPAAGILLPFGYGQGTGQALNYGSIYEADYSFEGGKSFGLTVAAMGFLSAAIGGVIHLNAMRRRGRFTEGFEETAEKYSSEDIQRATEIPMNGSIDKLTVQLSFVFGTYVVTYLVIRVLGNLVPSFKSVLYGFNFLFGVIFGTIINMILNRITSKTRLIQREYVNEFLMKRISGFFFDLMIVAGFAAIRIEVIGQYWPVLLTIGIVGAVSTYLYNKLVAQKLFEKYGEQQFMAMYGMLTGTASTGIVLLREIDRNFETPVAENLVYQNFPAIVFGFPMMLIAALAPKQPVLSWIIITAFFIVMNVILFRSFIFKRREKK